MYKNKRITLCLPCRNEGQHLRSVIESIPSYVDEVIVISNKSTDNTVSVAKSCGVIAIEENREKKGIGYGFAHIAGLSRATGDIIVCADGDGSYPFDAIKKTIELILNKQLDIVFCNRYPVKNNTKIPLPLRIGVGLLNLETRILFGYKIQDILSGMWVLRKEIVEDLDLQAGDWNLSPEIKIKAITNPNIVFSEYHISQKTRYGLTHQSYMKTGISHVFWIANYKIQTIKNAGFLEFINNRLMKYLAIATACLLLDFFLLHFLTHNLNIFYLISAAIAYTTSMTLNYILCTMFVFRIKNINISKNILVFTISFYIIGVVGLAITEILMWFFSSKLGIYYMLSKALSCILVFFWSFYMRNYTYNKFQFVNE